MPEGPAGPQGVAGPQGATGAQGPQGVAGPSIGAVPWRVGGVAEKFSEHARAAERVRRVQFWRIVTWYEAGPLGLALHRQLAARA